ncbi:MAG: molybdopterin biosynthesis protein [Deltaproteobacteria bacterium]|nr:molybdopterin biosynthesis protein [Deltaproteobacteria bacterium]MBW2498516.1 molybdopterin biosynthesis protein [Deltaproteobacteria bacterium]
MRQRQFLEVLDRDEAERRWRAVVGGTVLSSETLPLDEALGRVLAEDVRAEVDVPGFDRANMDGFAVRAADTFGASEEEPIRLRLNDEVLATGIEPAIEVGPGTATTIATGGMLPRGADAVAPIEISDGDPTDPRCVLLSAPRVPGAAVSFAGTDMGRGETVLFAGTRLTSRETGVLAAIGCEQVMVVRRPRVAILSTGDEIVQPGETMRPGLVYDSNGRILADAVRELGGEAVFVGSFHDDVAALREGLREALSDSDLVLLSGGTSKGEGDLNATVVGELDPGIVVHGVALKPGKPICLAAQAQKPVVILPGFPTSAIFTFHEFVAPLIRDLAGSPGEARETRAARMAIKVQSERGRLEYLLVGLVPGEDGRLAAYPMGKGSGSVTSFSRADGFVRIDRNTERVDVDTPVDVTLIGHEVPVADLVVIGSHCAGLDLIASELARRGFRVKLLAVGSQGGLAAAERGECDLAPIHLLDAESDRYNEPFLSDDLELIRGYRRMQGVATRTDETRGIAELLEDPDARMVNRNRGSGTRILIDRLLEGRKPPGHAYEPRSHYAVAAAIAQGRADWGVTIETVAREAGLRFEPLRGEEYDFAVPRSRRDRPALRALRALLEDRDSGLRRSLEGAGFGCD